MPATISTSTLAVVMFCEAASDQRTASTLAGRQLGLDGPLPTRGLDPTTTHATWASLKRHAQTWPSRKAQGLFGGRPGAAYATTARKALLSAAELDPLPDAVILMADLDRQPDRRVGMQQARDGSALESRTIIALPINEQEAWLIAGFEPVDADEHDRIRQFNPDPRMRTHELPSGRDNGDPPRTAKAILSRLTEGDAERARACIAETSLETLRQRGANNGLVDFLDDVTRVLGNRVG